MFDIIVFGFVIEGLADLLQSAGSPFHKYYVKIIPNKFIKLTYCRYCLTFWLTILLYSYLYYTVKTSMFNVILIQAIASWRVAEILSLIVVQLRQLSILSQIEVED